MSTPSRSYVLDRATKTHACMVVIRDATPSWEWPDISADDFEDKIDAAQTLVDTEEAEGADTTGKRGTRDAKLELLRGKMRQFVSLGKRKFRNDAAKLRLLKGLKTSAHSVKGTLDQALKADAAWTELDSTYVPEAGNTCAAFHTLRLECVTELSGVAKESAEESEAGGDVAVALGELYRLSVDWYQEAVRRFGPETSHGMMIRAEIPTQGGSDPDVPGPATLSAGAWNSTTHMVPLTFHSGNGTTVVTLQRRPVGDPVWVTVLDDIGIDADGNGTFDDEVPTGHYEYQFIPRNGDGVEGEPSNMVTVHAV